jgi:hypothetical protein
VIKKIVGVIAVAIVFVAVPLYVYIQTQNPGYAFVTFVLLLAVGLFFTY